MISAWLAGLGARFAGWFAAVGAAVAVLFGLMWSQRRQGRADERHAARERDLANRETRDAVDREVDRGGDGDAARRLRERWRRL